MARIEWVRQRLENWALWKARERGGGLGFSSSASFLREVDANRYREAIVPVDEVDASVTDAAVESLRFTRSHLFMTVGLIYVEGVGVRETARRMCKAESTIKANLEQADRALRQWFDERAERQRAAKAAGVGANNLAGRRLLSK